MDEEKARFEAIIDVGPIVISHTKNPVQEEALSFLCRVLGLDILCLVPLSTFLGAYLVMTKYPRVNRYEASRALIKTLLYNLPIYYEDIPKDIVARVLEDSAQYNVESWDSYIAHIAKVFQIRVVYTLDIGDFRKFTWLEPKLPIKEESLRVYHKWLEEKMSQFS